MRRFLRCASDGARPPRLSAGCRHEGLRQAAREEGGERGALEVIDDPDAPPLRLENVEREEDRLPVVTNAVEGGARATVRVDGGGAEAALAELLRQPVREEAG